MRKKIISVPFSRLLKLEVQDMALEVIRILEKHDPEELQLKPMYELLLGEKPKIDALEVPYRKHRASKKLDKLRKQRNVHVSAIKFETRKVVALDDTGYDDTVLLLQSEIERFLDDFYDSENERVMHRKLNQFFEKIDNNEALAEAMETLGFIPLLNNLKLNIADVINLLNIRSGDISTRGNTKTVSLRNSVVGIVKDALDDIRLAQLKNSELDYNPLINELNDKLKHYDYLINVRKRVNERKAEERKATESGALTTEATSMEVQTTVEDADNGYHQSQVYATSIKKMDNLKAGPTSFIESGNGSLESEEQKKAVASSWGTKQQPSDSDKA